MPLAAYTQHAEVVLAELESSARGLTMEEADRRRQLYGINRLPEAATTSTWRIFIRQFRDPLIYVLMFAALMSVLIGKYTDAAFIFSVLLLNAMIGMVQERSAQRSAASLDVLVTTVAHVVRDGETYEIDAEELVPGDIVLLESGDKVPADLRLLNAQELRVDESLLSGESLPVDKQAQLILAQDSDVAERKNMAFSGTLVLHGRGTAVVVSIGSNTQLGKIAEDVMTRSKTRPPLLLRMERFTLRLTWGMALVTLIIAVVVLMQGMALVDVMLLAAALAVAAIPEGLPVAVTIALAISVRRMSKRNVIARHLVAVESLGSCTFIATDKTGTLTRNEISAQCVALPKHDLLLLPDDRLLDTEQQEIYRKKIPGSVMSSLVRLSQCMTLANEGFIGYRNHSWVHHGDSMDVALLVMAHNLGISRPVLLEEYKPVTMIPYESQIRYGASLHYVDDQYQVYVKGAVETVLDMCSTVCMAGDVVEIDREAILSQADNMAAKGYRVLAAAYGNIAYEKSQPLQHDQLNGLCFSGLVGMIDPLRDESARAVQQCQQAGIEVAMLTGDHPVTALAIASQLKIGIDHAQLVTGKELKQYEQDEVQRDRLLQNKRVYARLEPHQKLDIINSLQRQGHFVAMTGDGANDAPALRVAHVGVAMGKSGTAVARETADIILADDNFASIIAGVEEGRIAYSNVRKVIHLLISTGFAEIVLFFLSLLAGLPVPLTAVQLLWLNLVTNGIQDVALAFEPGEGNELQKPPRKPDEAIFNQVMIERVILAALTMGCVAFASFYTLLQMGVSEEAARNITLLLMVMFENIHVFNSRSETCSVFLHNPLRNLFVLVSVVGAQLLHFAAMDSDWLAEILQIQPVSLSEWSICLLMALSLLLVSECYKLLRRHKGAQV